MKFIIIVPYVVLFVSVALSVARRNRYLSEYENPTWAYVQSQQGLATYANARQIPASVTHTSDQKDSSTPAVITDSYDWKVRQMAIEKQKRISRKQEKLLLKGTDSRGPG